MNMYTDKPASALPNDLASEISNGQIMGKEIYRKASAMVAWFRTLVFGNRNARTPQQVITLLGTKAAGMFTSAEAAAAFIGLANAVDGGSNVVASVAPAGWAYVKNTDGTVTLSGPPAAAAGPATPAAASKTAAA